MKRLVAWLERSGEKTAVRAAAIVSAALLLYAILESSRLKMWVDELYSYFVVNQPSASAVIGSLLEGCDNSPPLYALLVFWLRPVAGSGAFALRLPSAVGFVIACLCVFTFVRKRMPATYALAAMLFAAYKTLDYSSEGRPYGLVLACAGIALVTWQAVAGARVRNRRWTLVVLWFSLTVGIALHYYTVFLLAPFAAAECIRWYVARRPDWPVLISLSTPPLILILHWPFLRATGRFLPYFWAKKGFPFASAYLWHGKAGYLPMVVILLVPLAIWLVRPWNSEGKYPGEKCGLRIHEWACVGAITIMPYVVLAVAALTTRIFLDRYVWWSILGLSVLLAASLFHIARGEAWPAAALALLLAACLAVRCFSRLAAPIVLFEGEATKRQLAVAPAEPEAIVIAQHHVFLELSFYADPALRGRLVYLDSPELERRYTGIDTGPMLLAALAHRTNLRIFTYDTYLKSHRRFLLAADPNSWMPNQIRASGYQLKPLATESSTTLFEVTAGSR